MTYLRLIIPVFFFPLVIKLWHAYLWVYRFARFQVLHTGKKKLCLNGEQSDAKCTITLQMFLCLSSSLKLRNFEILPLMQMLQGQMQFYHFIGI